MVSETPALGPAEQLANALHGLTPGRIMSWIRDEGFRAKVELEGNMLRITTGLAGYIVCVWCPHTLNMEDRCEDLMFDVRLKLPDKVSVRVLSGFLNSFNLNVAPATVAALEPSGIIVIRMSFMVESTSSSLLFARYFFAFDGILQSFKRDLATALRAHVRAFGRSIAAADS